MGKEENQSNSDRIANVLVELAEERINRSMERLRRKDDTLLDSANKKLSSNEWNEVVGCFLSLAEGETWKTVIEIINGSRRKNDTIVIPDHMENSLGCAN